MINVLFDIDETLLSVPPGVNAKASSVMFKEVFYVDANEEIIDNVGKTEMGIIQEVLQKIGKHHQAEQEPSVTKMPSEAYRVWAQTTDKELKEHPARVLSGIPELLTALSKNSNIKLGLLSGNSSERAEAKLKSANLDMFFRNPETNQLNGVFGEMAPKRSQLFDIIQQQSTPEDRFVMIDDSLLGARMAQEHNIPAIMVATGKATKNELLAFTPHVFQDFGENRWQEAVKIIEKI